MRCDERFEFRPPLRERQRAQILIAKCEQIIDADEGRKLGHQLRGHALPVQALLQRVEILHAAAALDQQFAVEHRIEIKPSHQIRKRARYIFAGPRKKPRDALAITILARSRLHADAVPLPFGAEVSRFKRCKLFRLDRVREHRRIEAHIGRHTRRRGAAFEPIEEGGVRRLNCVPDILDFIRRLAANLRQSRACEARRHANAQSAGDQLQQSPAPVLIQPIEPVRDNARQIFLPRLAQTFDHIGDRKLRIRARRIRRPDQRNRLRQIADEIVRQAKQNRISPLCREIADQASFRVLERERARHRRQRPAAIGIGRGAEIVFEQRQLAQAARLISQTIEQRREPVHAAAPAGSSSSP